jgi:DNA-binding MarR family transcriptional regulator
MSSGSAADGLGEALGAVAKRLRAAAMTSLAEWDVTPSQLRALRALSRHGDLRSSELAAHLHIAARSATEVVDALEGKGIVQRLPDPTDRRATLVSLTPHGRGLLARMHRARGAESEKLFERLSAADRDHLARILQQLLAQ